MTRLFSLLWSMVVIVALSHHSTLVVEANNTATIIQLINNITLTGRTIFTAGNTSEDKALKWLVTDNDPMYQFVPGSKQNNTRLVQRYALATYYIDNAIPITEWHANQSECYWLYNICVSYTNATVTDFSSGTDAIPVEFGLLSSLRKVNVNLRAKTPLPTTIGKWTDLDYFSAMCNDPCKGTLPTSIGEWRNISEFYIWGTGFIGSLPATTGNWTNLRNMFFLGTYLNGTLPAAIGNWINLQAISIRNTGFIGTLPASIGNWTNLQSILMHYAGFNGTLPASVGNWTNLRSISIYSTGLNGTLPASIGNWTNVEFVGVGASQLSGSVPKTIGRWSSLQRLDLSSNQFTGTLPESITSWTRVEWMSMWGNKFSGSLPIGIWVNLTYVNVSRNQFTGTISPAIANWTRVRSVDLHTNNFAGTVPRSICSPNVTVYADCPDKVACWCCSRCAAPTITGILFRELRPDAQDGSWGPSTIDIPGFDHVAMSYQESVYESHPGYKKNTHVSVDLVENRTIPVVNGVQNVHTIGTFKHNSPNASTSPVVNFQVISIDNATALAMKNIITPKLQAVGFLAFNSIDEFIMTHAPSAQKGGNGKFTGCGLVEWAAEQAGVNNGQGFVPNAIEDVTTPNGTFPLLSPELMYSALQNQGLFFSTQNYMKGYFDPVDHLLTDPVGRRAGVVNRTQYHEIPNAFASPKGDIETIVVVNPIPGEYVLKVYGIPGKKGVASVELSGRPSVTVRTNGNASVQEQSLSVPVVSGCRGDVNGDGTINQTDLILLKGIIPRSVETFANTGDMNGDKQLNQTDVDILTAYLNRLTKAPTLTPTSVPVRIPPTPLVVPAQSPTPAPIRVPITPAPIRIPPTPRVADVPSPIASPAAAPKIAPVAVPIINVPVPVPVAPTKVPSLDRPASVPVAPTTIAPAVPPAPTVVAVPIVKVPATPTKVDSPRPTVTPIALRPSTPSRPVSGGQPCPATDKCSGGFMLHRTTLLSRRCIQKCISTQWTRWNLRWKTWKCGKCEMKFF